MNRLWWYKISIQQNIQVHTCTYWDVQIFLLNQDIISCWICCCNPALPEALSEYCKHKYVLIESGPLPPSGRPFLLSRRAPDLGGASVAPGFRGPPPPLLPRQLARARQIMGLATGQPPISAFLRMLVERGERVAKFCAKSVGVHRIKLLENKCLVLKCEGISLV